MHILAIHADKYSYRPATPAPKGGLAHFDRSTRRAQYFECLVAFTCVVAPAIPHVAGEHLADELARLAAALKCPRVVIMPMSHLVPAPADPHVALATLQHAYKQLRHRDVEVYLEAFGYVGSWKISAKSHARAVVGRWIESTDEVRVPARDETCPHVVSAEPVDRSQPLRPAHPAASSGDPHRARVILGD